MGLKETGAIQVNGNTTDVPVTDISVGNLTSSLQTQAWSKNYRFFGSISGIYNKYNKYTN